MKVLIPVISGKEASPAFLEQASKGAKSIIILFVVEPSMMSSEISHGSAVMREMRDALGKKRKKCEEIMEWGDTIRKITGTARLNNICKVALMGGIDLSSRVASSLEENGIAAEII